ncbi:MAG: hypothetical protein QXN66_04020 [Thermoplasmatales archaeon]
MVGNEFIEESIRRFSEAVQNNAQAIEEFKNQITLQGRPPQKAAVDLIRKYSGDLNTFFKTPPINAISLGYRGNVLGAVSSIRCSEYEKDGAKKIRCIGSLEDRTGRLPFTEFPEGSSRLSKGDLVLISNAYVGSFNDRPYLTLSSRIEISIIEHSGAANQSGNLKIKDLHPDMYDVKIKGSLAYIGKVNDVGKTHSTLFKGLLKDETGSIPVESWGLELKDGNVEIVGASVKQFNNRIYLHVGNGTQIRYETYDETGEFDNLELLISSSRGIFRGSGIIIKIIDKNLTVRVCTTCQRVVKGDKCQNHPESPVEKILRLSLILDDGHAAPLAYAYQKVLEKYVEGGKDKIREHIEKGTENELLPQLKGSIVMKPAKFTIFGFKGETGNYLELQELQILEGEALDSEYNKMIEALK